ncbi:MAG: metalloregulator ArsR/SmtB family transcription factor [Hydrotalea sp.]|nr:metalloregulator ArsR/SmtB family transcription factor [Hydrotalea sp.]
MPKDINNATDAINKWAGVFSAMSQETRLRLLMALAARETLGLTPTALAASLAIPANTLSFHLRALEASGLVKMRKKGREKIYCIEFHLVEQAIRFLMKEFFGATDIRFRVARRLSEAIINPNDVASKPTNKDNIKK